MFLRPSSTNLRQSAMRFGRVCRFASVLILGILVSGHIQSSRAAATDAQAGGLVTLRGNTRAEATALNDRGRVADDMALNHMMLLLHRTSEQEQALQQFIKDLHDPASPRFHHWITAAEFGERYGVSSAAISSVTNWLESQGFTVNLVYPNQMLVDFTGSAGQVRQAFHTEIHHLVVRGEAHIANMSDPQIPAELAPVVSGIVSLNDFRPHPTFKRRPSFTVSSDSQLVVPADLATIYNFTPAFTAGISGQGQTIVLIEDTDLYSTADWTTFRSTLGLASTYPLGSLAQVHPASTPTNNCADPDVNGNGDDAEAAIDVEWASAGAPSAAIELASCADTDTNWGAWVALQNLLNGPGQPPAIVSISYGTSEPNYGSGGNAYVSSLYQQAVTEGVSVFVSSGDEGAASTDYDAAYAASGINVSGFTSTPYNVSVGGTDFADTYEGTNSTYWNSVNTGNYGSALSYVPEIPWNDSCASVLLADYLDILPTYGSGSLCNTSGDYLDDAAGSGGPSGCATGAPTIIGVVSGTCAGYPKPSWQSGITGNPNDGVRDVPDVSLFAANGLWGHYYVVCYSDPNYGGASCSGTPDTWAGFGGTSVASPIMAAIQALANQASGSRWGNPNPTYYALAAAQFSSGDATSCSAALGNQVASNCIFYDITQLPLYSGGTGGDNDVPCLGVNCFAPSGTYGVLSTAPQTLTSAWVTALGSKYASAPACTLSGGGGSGATCNAIRTGVVNSISVTSGGGGYTSSPTCSLTGGGGTGASCTAYACTNGEACYPELAHFGSGYTSAPTCTLSGGGGSGAACSVTETQGIAVSLSAPGSGYTTLPNCVLTGGGGSDAACAATATNTSNSYQPAFGATTGWDFATGIGTVNAANLIASFPSGAVKFSPLTLAFASQTVNTTSSAQTLTVTNTGTSNLTISSVAIGGTDPGDFAKTAADYCTGANLKLNGTCTVDVTFTPSAVGSRSASLLFTDSASGSPQSVGLTGTGLNPVPKISGLSPSSATAGADAQTLTINGSNFVSISTVTYNGVAHPATFLSASQLTITLSSSDQATAGTYPVVVTNPSPGGGTSNSVNFTVNSSSLAWQQVPGLLSQVSVGLDGTVWGLNSAGQPYMFNSQTQTWQQAPGLLTQITVASNGVVWGLNAAGQIYRYDASSQGWDQIPGILSQLVVGSDGDVWGMNSSSQIYHFNAATQTWVQIPGALAQLAVGYDGAAWGINASQQVYRFNPGTQNWQQVAGLLNQVAVGADGDVWGINSAGQSYHFNTLSQQWENRGASLAQLAVGSASNVWGLDAAGGIWCFNAQAQAWKQVPGQLAQIKVGANGAVWGLNSAQQIYQFAQATQPTQTFHPLSGSLAQVVTGLDGEAWGIDGSQQVWHFDALSQSWQQAPGGLRQIAVGFGGNVWGLNAAGQIWQFNSSTQGWGAIGGSLAQIAVGADGSVWGLNSAGQIWRFNSSTQSFQQISGLLAQIAVGADGTVWGLNSAGQIFRFNPSTPGWDQIPGSLSQIAVGSANNVWGINATGQVFRYDSKLQSWDSIPGILTSLAVAFDGTVWGLNSAQQVWRFNVQTQSWDSIAGQMSQISVGADAVVWGVNASGQTYEYW